MLFQRSGVSVPFRSGIGRRLHLVADLCTYGVSCFFGIGRRSTIDALPEPVLQTLRWPKPPKRPAGNPSWTYMVNTGREKFAVSIGCTANEPDTFSFLVGKVPNSAPHHPR